MKQRDNLIAFEMRADKGYVQCIGKTKHIASQLHVDEKTMVDYTNQDEGYFSITTDSAKRKSLEKMVHTNNCPFQHTCQQCVELGKTEACKGDHAEYRVTADLMIL